MYRRWKKMFRRKLGIPALALAAVLTAAVPGVTFARDRGDHHEVFRGREGWRGDRGWDRDHDRGWNFGLGFYAAPVPVPVPAPAPAGYYDQFGVWHPYYYGNGYYGY
jgi:hypothetical protein